MSKVKRSRRTRWEISGWWALPILMLASAITVFSSADAGINAESLRLAISAFIVFVLLNITGTLVVRIASISSQPREKIRLTARPIMLIVLIVTVVFARVTDIDPALIIGTVLGVDYGTRLSKTHSAIAVIVGFAWSLGIGIAALIGYTAVASIDVAMYWTMQPELAGAAETAENAIVGIAPVVMILGEFLAMLAIAAIASGPISMLPFAFLDGATVYNWNKWVWGVVYLVALTVFSLVLAPLNLSWDVPAGTVTAWILTFVIYAVIALALWLYFVLTGRKTESQITQSTQSENHSSPESQLAENPK